MKNITKIATILLIYFISSAVNAQLPARVLVGYWQNWGSPNIPLSAVDSRYNVINLSFAEGGSSGGNVNALAMSALYTGYSTAQLISDIASARSAGKIICISVGGANGSFRLTSTTDKNTFVSVMKSMITQYGVDGIDIDLENSSYVCMSGTIQTPTDPHTTNMIIGLQELLSWYQTTYGRKMILTMAPEATYTTGGLSSYQVNNSCGGSYLPIIEALRNDIDLIMVQLYNSGTQYGLDGQIYTQGTPDFVVSQTEAMIQGFTCASGLGTYSGLSESKIVVALPACASAGSGAMSTTNVKNAIEYLLGTGTRPGSYTLIQSGGYPYLRGMMTWSINSDYNNCGNSSPGNYAYAANYQSIFGSLGPPPTNGIFSSNASSSSNLKMLPTVTSDYTTLEISNYNGKSILLSITDTQGKVQLQQNYTISNDQEKIGIDMTPFKNGMYFVNVYSDIQNETTKIIKQ